jgi:hypothetical protein
MKKNILYLVCLQICLFFTTLTVQGQCDTLTAPTCLDSFTQHAMLGNVNCKWQSSHGGAPMTSTNDAPGSTGGSIKLYSSLNMGNGVFTCFKFQRTKTYRVCFWVRNNSGWPSNPFGRLYVHATLNQTTAGGSALPSPTNILIDQSYAGPPQQLAAWPNGEHEWEFISTTITISTNRSYNGLWFYALNPAGPPPPGPMQHTVDYILELDDIRVTELIDPPSFSVSPTSASITACGPTGKKRLTITPSPPTPGVNYVATWTPSDGITNNNSEYTDVWAAPCSTTTYKIVLTDPKSSCHNCVREVLNYTVNVTPSGSVNYPTGIVGCTALLPLSFTNTYGCGSVVEWRDPTGTLWNPSIPANATHTGEWTLKVYNSAKGCNEEYKFNITVGSCCQSNPSFTTSGCNPVTFTQGVIGAGIINKKGSVWTFGDGSSSDQENPIHSYTVAGPTTVCLTTLFEDQQGESCCSRKCSTINVCSNSNPCSVNANFTFKAVAGLPNTFDFTDMSTGNGTICNYEWHFPGGVIITTTVPTIRHSFSGEPPWEVCLIVTNCVYNPNGSLRTTCKDTICLTIMGWPPPLQTAVKPVLLAPIPDIKMYPNPSKGSMTIEIGESVARDSSMVVRIKNMLGQDVGILYSGSSFSKKTFKLPDVATGIYLIEIYSGDKVIYKENLSVQ